MSVITIVGSGMMGSAMSVPASDNGHEVRLVGSPLDGEIISRMKKDGFHITLNRKLPKTVKPYYVDELDSALKGADLVIGGISSFGVEWFAQSVLPKVDKSVPVLSVTKGMSVGNDGSLVPFPIMLSKRPGLEELSLNAIGGPCICFELCDHKQTEVAYCGKDIKTLEKIRDMLSTDYYHIRITTDIYAVECAVAMKNAYAMGVSLAIGLTQKELCEDSPEKYNPEAALFLQSTREMLKLIMLGSNSPDEIALGAGDLYVTIFGGRTRRLGTLLGLGNSFEKAKQMLKGVTLESVAIITNTAKALRIMEKAGRVNTKDFPLLMHMDQIINQNQPVNIPWDEFAK